MGGGIFRIVPESSMSGLESAEQASGIYREVGASCMSGLESGGSLRSVPGSRDKLYDLIESGGKL